jgi:hypothetical protein
MCNTTMNNIKSNAILKAFAAMWQTMGEDKRGVKLLAPAEKIADLQSAMCFFGAVNLIGDIWSLRGNSLTMYVDLKDDTFWMRSR